jgi:hypothetical protein
MLNEAFGWLWISLGFLTGVLLGLRFEREEFLGGYGSWPRRMLRLGHVCFFALGGLNVLFALSLPRLVEAGVSREWAMVASWSLVAGAVLMPTCCFLSAWRKGWTKAFPLPVVLLVTGGTITWVGMFLGGWSGAGGVQ